jgi:hypothetical protein
MIKLTLLSMLALRFLTPLQLCMNVQVYKSALEVRLKYFGGNNLTVAMAHEDLAYATYVFEYSSGKFQVPYPPNAK